MQRTTKYKGISRLLLVLIPALLAAAACGGSGGTDDTQSASASSSPAGSPHRGGSVVDLLGAGGASWPAGLDPATNTTGGGNLSQQQAIFGGLFLLRADNDGQNARIVPNQAASGTFSNDLTTLTIKLRPGIKFSDGTPLDAKAVIWNFERDSKSSCTCAPTWKLRKDNPFTSPDPLTVQVHLAAPNAALLHNFPASNVNWIASPTAFKKMGEQAFRLKPVGAGPFVVVSNKLSSKLVLARNPKFFKKGKPYLDHLTFQIIEGDQAAYQALLAGAADAYEGVSSLPITKQAQASSKLQVTEQPPTSPFLVRFNTNIPPFNNIKAREAIFYATDWQAISKGLFDGKPTVVQGFTTPADLFYHQKTPGYRTYDPDKAKALVKELGGLSFELDTTAVQSSEQITTALQTQWEKVGMKVTTKALQISGVIKRLNSGKWQSTMGTAGAWDPAVGVGVAFSFASTSPFTGVNDPQLNTLFENAIATADNGQRDRLYQKIAKLISDKAYGMFGFPLGTANFAVKGVSGPGLTTKIPALFINPGIIWSEVWTERR